MQDVALRISIDPSCRQYSDNAVEACVSLQEEVRHNSRNVVANRASVCIQVVQKKKNKKWQ